MTRMSDRYARYVESVMESVTSSPGETARDLRDAVHARARQLVAHGPTTAAADPPLPQSLAPYIDAVLLQAYRITDYDVDTLSRSHSDDVIFETTVNAAVGAGVARLERALSILRASR
jgi:alkylhydroperoxidase family enzyme